MYRYRNNTCPCMRQNMPNQDTYVSPNVMDPACSCGFNDPSVFPDNFMYGQSYVPIQYIDTTFSPAEGLQNGSLFPELISPYEPCQSMVENNFLRQATMNEGRCPNAL